MKKTALITALASALLSFHAGAAQSVRLEDCGPAADGFAFYVDASGSMMEEIGDVKEDALAEYERLTVRGERKTRERTVPPANEKTDGMRRAELAKAFVLKASKYAIEKGGMTSSLYAVAPFARLVPPEKRTSDEFAKAVEERLNDDMEVFGRPTWAGTRGLEHFAAKREGTTAALLVTDGRFDREAEGKVSPLEALKAFKAANPSSCLHIVSAAYRPEEKAALDELAGVMTCTKTYDLEALMTDDALFSRFLEEVFYKDCTRVSSIEIEDLYFEFDRSDITAESRAKLLKAVELIRARKTGEKLIVAGWTDWTGSDAYNEKLSSRRAEAVKAFFVEKGLPADEIGTVGEGESMKYDNRTKEGRRMNRRVELRFLAQER